MHRCLWLTSIKAYDAVGDEDILFPPLATLRFFGLCQLEECFIILRVFVAFSIASGFRGAKGAPTHFHLLSPPLSLSTELFLVGEPKLICHSRKKRTVKSRFFPVQGIYSGHADPQLVCVCCCFCFSHSLVTFISSLTAGLGVALCWLVPAGVSVHCFTPVSMMANTLEGLCSSSSQGIEGFCPKPWVH